MEKAFGTGFSDVRMHTGPRAADLSQSLGARAFTVGNHVAFGAGEYQPGTPVGDALIAHELAHVVQQRDATGLDAERTETGRGKLEGQANMMSVRAVMQGWNVASGIARRALPLFRTGLTVQRCSRDADTRAQQAEAFFWGVVSGLGPPGLPQPSPEAAQGVLDLIYGLSRRDYQMYCLTGSHVDDRFQTVDWGWYQRQAREQGNPVDVDSFHRSIWPLFRDDLWADTVRRGDSGNICP